MGGDRRVLDDFTNPGRASGTGTQWRCFTDRVMGGLSVGEARFETLAGRSALRLRGEVSLQNNGGFIQAALDLATGSRPVDVSAYRSLEIIVCGDGRDVGIHLRTADCRRPWESYRAQLATTAKWATVGLPFADFVPYRLDMPLDRTGLRRIGIVAIGEPGPVDIAVAGLALIP
jgi:hypothetical protein